MELGDACESIVFNVILLCCLTLSLFNGTAVSFSCGVNTMVFIGFTSFMGNIRGMPSRDRWDGHAS